MDRDLGIERNGEALKRILVALVAMAGLLDAARLRLPRDVYRAVLRPLRAAEAAVLLLPDVILELPSDRDSIEAALLKRRFAALARAIADLIRRLLTPPLGVDPEPTGEAHQPLANLQYFAREALEKPDTS